MATNAELQRIGEERRRSRESLVYRIDHPTFGWHLRRINLRGARFEIGWKQLGGLRCVTVEVRKSRARIGLNAHNAIQVMRDGHFGPEGSLVELSVGSRSFARGGATR